MKDKENLSGGGKTENGRKTVERQTELGMIRVDMAVGRHHSVEKAAETAALGIELLPNQTIKDYKGRFIGDDEKNYKLFQI